VSQLAEKLTLRVGLFRRSTTVTAGGVRRAIDIRNCVVVGASDASFEDLGSATISLFERIKSDGVLWKDDPEKIGVLSLNRSHINVHLPHLVFEEFWAVALATDGVVRDITFDVESSGSTTTLRVSSVHLSEAIVKDGDDPVLGKVLVASRKHHPVVVELERMKKFIRTLFWTIVIIYLASEALRWFTHS
jgi:hypothetical protein